MMKVGIKISNPKVVTSSRSFPRHVSCVMSKRNEIKKKGDDHGDDHGDDNKKRGCSIYVNPSPYNQVPYGDNKYNQKKTDWKKMMCRLERLIEDGIVNINIDDI